MATFRLLILLGLGLLSATAPLFSGEEKAAEKQAAHADLSESDLTAIRRVLELMAGTFVEGNAESTAMLFDVSADRRVELRNRFAREFSQTDYAKFTIVQIQPDDTLQPNRFSVDVQFSYERLPVNDAERAQYKKGRDDFSAATTHSFILQRRGDGTFALVNSGFFDTLGLRRGMSLVTDGLLALMLLCALLAFWVWMGYEAYRARPRRTFWRAFVLVPVAGPLIFFGAAYLPRKFRGDLQE